MNAAGGSAAGRWRWLRSAGPIAGLAAAWALFALTVGPNFVSLENQRQLLFQTAIVGTAAVGATIIMISGGLDLSVGSTVALGSMVVALIGKAGGPAWAAALGGVATGMVVGGAIGLMVVGRVAWVAAVAAAAGLAWWGWGRWGGGGAIGAGVGVGAVVLVLGRIIVPRVELTPFIVTLGMMGVLRGLAKALGDNQPVDPPDMGWLEGLLTPRPSGVLHVAPAGVWMMVALAGLATVFLRRTVAGRRAFAIGGNAVAARYAGVPVERTKLLVYAIGVGCAGVASVLQFSDLSQGNPTEAAGLELKVIAAVVIGGASLSGGEGSVWGTLMGALLLTVIGDGCTKLHLPDWVQEVVTGGIIVAAVVLDRVRRGERK